MSDIYERIKAIFEGKRVVILGYGREGRVWLALLQKLSVCREIAIADMNPPEDFGGYKVISGDGYLELCADYDLILQSPGVVIKNSLDDTTKSRILSQTDLLSALKPCKIIGVTGTKGKSTVSSLIYHFLSACKIKSMLIGNIGIPPLQRLSEMTPDMTVVCEMGCHQLEFARHSPDISVLLNIFPEHLDHYVDFNAYANAKRNIYRHQQKGDIAIINKSELPADTKATVYGSALGESADVFADNNGITIFGDMIPIEKINTRLKGRHNLYNIAMALAAAKSAGADISGCLESLPDFNGLPHRLEYVATINGVEYINDSICTIPQAAIAAIKAFDGTDCVILGGMDRGIPYNSLGDFLNTGAVKNVILLPDSGKRIGELITCEDVNVCYADDMKEAVLKAHELAKKRVILCPASASYGFYKNFEERGEHFKALVLKLQK